MRHSQVIDNIKEVAKKVLPKGSALYLYGSRARGDYHEGSDWDLLLSRVQVVLVMLELEKAGKTLIQF